MWEFLIYFFNLEESLPVKSHVSGSVQIKFVTQILMLNKVNKLYLFPWRLVQNETLF